MAKKVYEISWNVSAPNQPLFLAKEYGTERKGSKRAAKFIMEIYHQNQDNLYGFGLCVFVKTKKAKVRKFLMGLTEVAHDFGEEGILSVLEGMDAYDLYKYQNKKERKGE